MGEEVESPVVGNVRSCIYEGADDLGDHTLDCCGCGFRAVLGGASLSRGWRDGARLEKRECDLYFRIDYL